MARIAAGALPSCGYFLGAVALDWALHFGVGALSATPAVASERPNSLTMVGFLNYLPIKETSRRPALRVPSGSGRTGTL